jgi:hypothetical protein
MCQLPIEIMSNDLDVDLLNDLRDLILTAAFSKGVVAVEVLFSVICSCLSYLEGDESSIFERLCLLSGRCTPLSHAAAGC